MSNYVTIARPYAKAVFEHALAVGQLKEWSTALQLWAAVLSENQAIAFLNNPAALLENQTEFLLEFVLQLANDSERSVMAHLLHLLAVNKRLLALPAISFLFDFMRAEQEKTLNVKVSSFLPLTTAQEKELAHKLKNRLKREIALSVSIDKALLGGAIIQAGDLVIDGSVRGELNKLRANLVA